MLKHRINKEHIKNDTVHLNVSDIQITDIINEDDFLSSTKLVTCTYDDNISLKNVNEVIGSNDYTLTNMYNEDMYSLTAADYMNKSTINSYNIRNSSNDVMGTFSFSIPFLSSLIVKDMTYNSNPTKHDIYVTFTTPHYYTAVILQPNMNEDEEDTTIYLWKLKTASFYDNYYIFGTETEFRNYEGEYFDRISRVDIITYNMLKFEVVDGVNDKLSNLKNFFYTETLEDGVEVVGNYNSMLRFFRPNFLFNKLSTPSFLFYNYKSKIAIPLSTTQQINLNKEEILNEYISDARRRSINKITDMEKDIYYPVIKKQNGYDNVYKIKFNFHFIRRDDENWISEMKNVWNGVETSKRVEINSITYYIKPTVIEDISGTKTYEIINNRFKIGDNNEYFVDDNEVVEFKNEYEIINKEITIDDVKYTITENELTEGNKVYKIINNKVSIGEKHYIFDTIERTGKLIEIINNYETKITNLVLNDTGFFSYADGSYQSDLLANLNFTNSDVRYQKNKLKKSFVRLSFYDSPNMGGQNLLSYSTIFMDGGGYFTKYVKYIDATSPKYRNISYSVLKNGENFEWNSVYYDIDEESSGSVGIRVDREPIISDEQFTNEEIEERRLSSQITVTDKYNSDASSEGFYLYLWKDILPIDELGKTGIQTVYMKVEFNHAGYGRIIPFMMPYWDKEKWCGATDKEIEQTKLIEKVDKTSECINYTVKYKKRENYGIKSFEDIVHDWDNTYKNGHNSYDDIENNTQNNATFTVTTDGQYGPKQYSKFSYIKIKIGYDETNKKYIYYLDDDIYGVQSADSNELIFNLYEAKMV